MAEGPVSSGFGPGGTGRRWLLWTLLGSAAYLIHAVLGRNSAFVETAYSRGVFVGLRWAWDYTLGLSPVPLIYVVLAAAVLGGGWLILRRLSRERSRPHASTLVKAGKFVRMVAAGAGGLVFFFYVLWGFNYNRPGVETQLKLDVSPLELTALKAEVEWAEGSLSEARAAIPGATDAALGSALLPADLESGLRAALSKVLKEAGYPAPGRVRVRSLWPGGLIMRLSGSGFYFPFVAEGYTADNLTPAEQPFTTAHEMVHAFGLTDEGDANFLGFLACASSENPAVRYSGFLAYWEYAFAELARASRDEAGKMAGRLPEGVRADLRAERENWNRYRGPIAEAAQAVYERYLRSQGVREGIRSYDRFVNLVAAWKKRYG
jgi:hypothetical protein